MCLVLENLLLWPEPRPLALQLSLLFCEENAEVVAKRFLNCIFPQRKWQLPFFQYTCSFLLRFGMWVMTEIYQLTNANTQGHHGCRIHLPEHLTLASGKGHSWEKLCEKYFLTYERKAVQNCKSIGCLFLLANSSTGGGNGDSFSSLGVSMGHVSTPMMWQSFFTTGKGLWFLVLRSVAKTGRPIAPSCRFLCVIPSSYLTVKSISFEHVQRDQLCHLDLSSIRMSFSQLCVLETLRAHLLSFPMVFGLLQMLRWRKFQMLLINKPFGFKLGSNELKEGRRAETFAQDVVTQRW